MRNEDHRVTVESRIAHQRVIGLLRLRGHDKHPEKYEDPQTTPAGAPRHSAHENSPFAAAGPLGEDILRVASLPGRQGSHRPRIVAYHDFLPPMRRPARVSGAAGRSPRAARV